MAANISPVFSSTSSSVPSSKLCLDIFFSLWCRSKILVQWSLVLLERDNMMHTILVPASLTSNYVQKSLTSITLKAGGLKRWKSLESPVSHNRPKSKLNLKNIEKLEWLDAHCLIHNHKLLDSRKEILHLYFLESSLSWILQISTHPHFFAAK